MSRSLTPVLGAACALLLCTPAARAQDVGGGASGYLKQSFGLGTMDHSTVAWPPTQLDQALLQGTQQVGAGNLQQAVATFQGAVKGTGSQAAEAHYFLARAYDALSREAVDPSQARAYAGMEKAELQGAARLAGSNAYATNSSYASRAKARLADLASYPTPLEQTVLLQHQVLSRGDHGAAVAELQQQLGLTPTGEFDPATDAALRAFQRKHHLVADGKVGPNTLSFLSDPLTKLGVQSSKAYAYRHGKRLGTIEVVTIDGKPVAVPTARSFLRMRAAAARDGIHLRIVSGFRSYAEQASLYHRYRNGTGNLAAPPGYSNHEDGAALDLNASDPGVYRWLTRNARRFDFKRTVPSEIWHWEYRP